jgi:zinc transport system substrate-binding protein
MPRQAKRWGPLVLVLALGWVGCLVLVSCSQMPPSWGNDKPRVVVTIPPLYSFVRAVAGEHGEVKVLCTDKGPHDYGEPPFSDKALFADADLFFANGLDLERRFADSLQEQSNNPNLRYIKLGEILPASQLIPWSGTAGPHHHGDEDHHHGEYDPHVWLGIEEAIIMVQEIRDELKRADPDHEEDYDTNAKAYLGKLEELKGWKEKLAKKDAKVISAHEALRYFARSFGVEIVGVLSLEPGYQPTSNQIANLVKRAKEKKVRVIATEPQYPRTSAETLQSELKTQGVAVALVKIDTLETVDPKELAESEKKKPGSWYLKKMDENLRRLDEALGE